MRIKRLESQVEDLRCRLGRDRRLLWVAIGLSTALLAALVVVSIMAAGR